MTIQQSSIAELENWLKLMDHDRDDSTPLEDAVVEAIEALKACERAQVDAGAAALSRQREDANVAKARHAFSQELALTVLMLDSTDKMEAALRVLNPLLDALILAVQQSAALSQPSRQRETLDVTRAKNAIQHRFMYGLEGDEGHQSPTLASDTALIEALVQAVQSAALVPQGCKTCATCKYVHGTHKSYCQHPQMMKIASSSVCVVPQGFGCIFHTPAPPRSPDPPQEK